MTNQTLVFDPDEGSNADLDRPLSHLWKKDVLPKSAHQIYCLLAREQIRRTDMDMTEKQQPVVLLTFVLIVKESLREIKKASQPASQ